MKTVILSLSQDAMTIKDFVSEIKELYKKHMPKSKVFVKFSSNLAPWITINCCLAQDKEECVSNYFENDIVHAQFLIWLPKNTKEDSENLPEEIVLEVKENAIFTKPEEGSYLAFGREKLPFRKSKGNGKKILKVLDKYFKSIKDTIVKLIEEDRIPNGQKTLAKSKV